jgi:hypothetical protein
MRSRYFKRLKMPNGKTQLHYTGRGYGQSEAGMPVSTWRDQPATMEAAYAPPLSDVEHARALTKLSNFLSDRERFWLTKGNKL